MKKNKSKHLSSKLRYYKNSIDEKEKIVGKKYNRKYWDSKGNNLYLDEMKCSNGNMYLVAIEPLNWELMAIGFRNYNLIKVDAHLSLYSIVGDNTKLKVVDEPIYYGNVSKKVSWKDGDTFYVPSPKFNKKKGEWFDIPRWKAEETSSRTPKDLEEIAKRYRIYHFQEW